MKNEQNNADNNGVGPVYVTTVLSKDQFKEFYTFLNIIKPYFNDLCIVNGTFRSRSNDRSTIVETGFSYFENLDFCIDDIKLLVKMLSTFDKKSDITVTTNEKNIIFTDGFKRAHVANANLEFIHNKFFSDEEMYEKIFKNIDVDKPFIKETLPKAIVYNINKMTRDLYTNEILIKHKENYLNKGYLLMYNKKGIYDICNVDEYIIELKKEFLTPMVENSYFIVVSLPFIFNKADMTLNYYIDRDRPIIYAIYNTSLNRLRINTYGRSSLIEDDE